MIETLELNHFRMLSALYELGSISAAAESLALSQQAVSLQLKRVRKILGDPVFVRTGHGMVPTAYGELIQPHVEQVLTAIHAMPRPRTTPLQDMERTLSICATDHAQHLILGDLIRELHVAAPRVRVKISNIEAAGLVRRMQQGEIDVAFTSSAYVPEGLVSVSLFAERYVCVAARALVPAGCKLSLPELVAHDFLVVSPAVAGFEGSAGAWFEQQGLKRRVAASLPSFAMAQACLRRSDFVAFMPSRLLPCEGLVEVPLEKYPPGYEVVATFHPSAQHDPLLTWVLNCARKRLDIASEPDL